MRFLRCVFEGKFPVAKSDLRN